MVNEEIKLSGYLSRIIYRDEKTGVCRFILNTEDKRFAKRHIGEKETGITVIGVMPLTPAKVPLQVTGTYRNNNKPLFYATKCEQLSSNDAFTKSFLKEKYFTGIGDKTIEKVLKIINGDIFAFCAQKDAAKILTADKTMTLNIATLLVSKIRELKNMEHLLHYLMKYGGDYSSAKAIYDKYEDKSVEVIEENPYLLYHTGLSYEAREAIAKSKGIKTHDDRRMRALLLECFRISESKGNTCLPLAELFHLVNRIEKRANMGYHSNPIIIISTLLQAKSEFVYREEEDGLYFYTRRTFEVEERAARHIVRLSRSKQQFPIVKGDVEVIEETSGITYGEEQKRAFELFSSSGIKILTGGPGTGKSTVIDGLLKYYRQMFPDNSVALCAPTGTAAKKLRHVTNEDAKTIHKLLKVQPFGNDNMKYKDEYDQLPYDLIIVDESSMIDLELFMMLLSGAKSGSLLLLVGDEDQLPSVGAGNVLHDMLESGYIPSCRLRQVYRQKGNSSIVENSIKIRNGETDLIQDASFEIIRVSNRIELQKKSIDVINRESGGRRSRDIKLYSPVRSQKYTASTTLMNKELQAKFGNKADLKITYNGTDFVAGDPIIMTQNNYKLGYMNGDEGVVSTITEEDDGSHVMILQMDDGSTLELSNKSLGDVELAYALTIHKSQGAECDTAVLVLPEEPRQMLERSLIYVGATRAKRKDILIVEGNALNYAIQNSNKHRRYSGLNNQVRIFAK